MKNPYKVLGLSQDANATEIAKAQIPALKARKHTPKEITEAQATLRKPASRLAADFTFPILDRGTIAPLTTSIKSEEVDFGTLNVDKYNSLK